jgi:hypothetical protein
MSEESICTLDKLQWKEEELSLVLESLSVNKTLIEQVIRIAEGIRSFPELDEKLEAIEALIKKIGLKK